jgi:murein DD-endopeptidase MepM/ murein hydrolase activator NlpD
MRYLTAIICGAIIVFHGYPATGQNQVAQGGPLPEPRDNASAEIARVHPQIVQRLSSLSAAAAVTTNIPPLNFPLRLKPQGRGASPFGISNFVDLDPSAALLDWNCGARTYNGHAGNDFFIAPFPWLKMDQTEVDILAAESGTIAAAVDGNFDRQCVGVGDPGSYPANYVSIRQGNGLFAYYYHMKNGSVTTKPVGSTVAAGERLGSVGSSGHSSSPHLHFELRDAANRVVDAFSGTCNPIATSWKHQWHAQLDPRMIQVATHSAPPVIPSSCGSDETPNYADTFAPGSTVYRVVYLRDQGTSDAVKMDLLRPDGTLANTCNSGVPSSGIFHISYWYCTYVLPSNAPSGTWHFRASLGSQVMDYAFFVNASPAATALLSAVLPGGRSVQTNKAATIFASVINNGQTAAEGCWIQTETPLAAAFSFQTTNPSTNQLNGSPNTAVSILPGATQTFLIALQPDPAAVALAATVVFRFKCTNADAAPTFEGVNTMLLSLDPNPVPDIIPIGVTPSGDGIMHIPGSTGTAIVATAAVNIGAAATLTMAPSATTSLPITLSICETNSDGSCKATPGASTSRTFNTNDMATFTVFAQGNGNIAFDPANNRVRLDFIDAGGIIRGQTSAALRTN